MESAFVEVEISMLFPDPSQPRKVFDEEAINALREDIKANGLKEALDVNPLLDGRTTKYLIIDGECRFHAIEGIDDFGMVPCNLHAYKSQRHIDRHRASKHFHRKDWNPADRAEWLKYYMSTHKIRQQELAREFSVKQSTVSEWLAPTRDARLLKALRNGEIGFKQAVLLSRVDDVETREKALRDAIGKSKTDTEEIIARAIITPETPKEEGVSETEITEREALINSIDENLRERLIDATKDMTLHDTERVVKQVIMGVRIDEAVRAVKLSKVEAPQEEEGVEIKVHEEEGEQTLDKEEASETSSSSETDSICAFGDSIINKEKGAEGDFGTPDEMPDSASTQSPPLEEGIDVEQPEEVLPTSKAEDVEPPPETEKPEKKTIDPATQILSDVDKIYKTTQLVQKHLEKNGFEGFGTTQEENAFKSAMLLNHQELESIIETVLGDGGDEKGSWGFCLLTRVTHPLKDFDFHAIGLQDCPDARSMIIETQKKLTKGLNVVDNIAKKGA